MGGFSRLRAINGDALMPAAAAVVGVVGAVAGANAAKSAAKKQAGAIQAGTDAQVALAQQQMALTQQLFAPYLQDEQMAKAYVEAIFLGSGSYTPPGGSPITITRDQVMAQLEQTPLAQYAEELYQGAQALADETRTGADALSDEEYAALRGQYDENYGQLLDRYGQARTGRRELSDEQLAQRLALESDSYAAWLPQSQLAEQRATDAMFSRGGVTGLVGQTRRGVAETAQEAEMERNLRRLEGVQRAYEPYFDEYQGAELDYWQDALNADRSRADLYNYATEQRADQRRGAYDAQRAAYDANYARRASDQLANYADYANYWGDRQRRGEDARRTIASGGENYADRASQAIGQGAQAQAEKYAAYGRADANMYGGVANAAGSAYDAYSTARKMPSYSQPYIPQYPAPSSWTPITTRSLPRYGG